MRKTALQLGLVCIAMVALITVGATGSYAKRDRAGQGKKSQVRPERSGVNVKAAQQPKVERRGKKLRWGRQAVEAYKNKAKKERRNIDKRANQFPRFKPKPRSRSAVRPQNSRRSDTLKRENGSFRARQSRNINGSRGHGSASRARQQRNTDKLRRTDRAMKSQQRRIENLRRSQRALQNEHRRHVRRPPGADRFRPARELRRFYSALRPNRVAGRPHGGKTKRFVNVSNVNIGPIAEIITKYRRHGPRVIREYIDCGRSRGLTFAEIMAGVRMILDIVNQLSGAYPVSLAPPPFPPPYVR